MGGSTHADRPPADLRAGRASSRRWLLVLLRLVQGFAVGGEWGGAVLMVTEYGDAKRRGFWAGWPQAGVPAGNLLAAGVLAMMVGDPVRTRTSWPGAGACRSCCPACWSRSAIGCASAWPKARSSSRRCDDAGRAAEGAGAGGDPRAAGRHRHRRGPAGRARTSPSTSSPPSRSPTSIEAVAPEPGRSALNAMLIGAAVEVRADPAVRGAVRPGRPPAGLSSGRGRRWRSGASPSSACSTPARRRWSCRRRRRPGPARRDVRPAGGVHRRAVPDADALFRRLAGLPGDLDLRRLARADHRARALQGHASRRSRSPSTWPSPARSARSRR